MAKDIFEDSFVFELSLDEIWTAYFKHVLDKLVIESLTLPLYLELLRLYFLLPSRLAEHDQVFSVMLTSGY